MTRTAGDIGAGLAPARPARGIRAGERIHVIGVAGAGASAAALLAASGGAVVTGCDAGGRSPYTPALEASGIQVAWRHDPSHVTDEPRPERLAVSKALTAVDPEHPELMAARALGIPIEAWQQVVADAAFRKTVVAVAGTHGKSTTAGWLTHVLVQAGRDPSAFVGALLPESITGGLPATARQGGGDLFVVEADEYAGNFDAYRPDLAIVTNIDFDHPDVFVDRDAVIAAFASWLDRAPAATLVVNVGDPGARALLDRLAPRTGRTLRVALVPGASSDATHSDAAGSEATRDPAREGTARVEGRASSATRLGVDLDGLHLPLDIRLAGDHNAANGLVVAAAAVALGLAPGDVARGIGTFDGVGRRLERKGEAGGVVVYDDYGHHPTAIRATLAAVRQREPGRRVWLACEPLTYHRTAALLDELAEALAGADGIAVADIWPGRDRDQDIASSAGLAAAVHARVPAKAVAAPGDVEATADWLAKRVEAGDVVLVMGGGRSYVVAERLLDLLGGQQ